MWDFTWFHRNYRLRNAAILAVKDTARMAALQIFLRKFYGRYKILETGVSVSARGLWILEIQDLRKTISNAAILAVKDTARMAALRNHA